MAVITPVKQDTNFHGEIWLWETCTENDTFTPVVSPDNAEKSVMILGTFGGDVVPFMVTLDPTSGTMVACKDAFGTDIELTEAGCVPIGPAGWSFAPGVPEGTSVDVDVYLFIVRK